MRLDKFLKVSRLVKRRPVAKELASSGRIEVNGRIAKAGTEVAAGDELILKFGEHDVRVRIKEIKEHVRKEEAQDLYEIL